jgi:uncharacterized protein involved in type VI secretion and phage assembly
MNKINGVVIGIVKDLDDPKKLGRIKITFPWLPETNQSFWARIATTMAGANRGTWFMPEKEDEVLVAFERGDPDHPYIIGFLWNGEDKPPKPIDQSQPNPNIRMIRSVNGHEIEIYDPDTVVGGDNGYIRMKYANAQGKITNTVELTNRGISITSITGIEIKAPSVVINGRPVLVAISPI